MLECALGTLALPHTLPHTVRQTRRAPDWPLPFPRQQRQRGKCVACLSVPALALPCRQHYATSGMYEVCVCTCLDEVGELRCLHHHHGQLRVVKDVGHCIRSPVPLSNFNLCVRSTRRLSQVKKHRCVDSMSRRTRVGNEGVVEGHCDCATRPEREEAFGRFRSIHSVDAHSYLPTYHFSTSVHA